MLEEITKLKLGKENNKIKIGNCYVCYSEAFGFTLQLCLGMSKLSYSTSYLYYPIAYLKGKYKTYNRSRQYFIDLDYINFALDIGLQYTLNQKIERELLFNTCFQLFNISYEVDMKEVIKWYTKNRMIDNKLPEITNFVPSVVKKSELKEGTIYTNLLCNKFYVYVGKEDNLLGFYAINTYSLAIVISKNMQNLTLLDFENIFHKRNYTYEEFLDSGNVNWVKTMPKLYHLSNEFPTNDVNIKFLVKLQRFELC